MEDTQPLGGHLRYFVTRTLRALRHLGIQGTQVLGHSRHLGTRGTLFSRLDFNLRIIRTYCTAGDGKGTIDGMPSFGVKNILRKGIVTYDVFFNTSEDIVDYLTIKCPQFNYTHLPSDDIVKSRISQNDAMIIKDCMKQHLMIFSPNEPVFCKEYSCSCNACLRFDFKECSGDDIPVYAELPCNYSGDNEEVDAIDKTEHIFDFLNVPSFVSLFSGNQNETLYFVKATEKGTAQKDITNPYCLFIGNDEKFLNF